MPPELAYDLASGGPVGTKATYAGYSVSTLAWNSATWAPFAGVPAAFVDVTQSGITRSNSDFTFAAAGDYWVAAMANYANGSSGKSFGLRLRDTVGAVTVMNAMAFANSTQLAQCNMIGPFTVAAAGQVLRLEYVTGIGGTTAGFGNSTLDGEALRTMTVGFIKR